MSHIWENVIYVGIFKINKNTIILLGNNEIHEKIQKLKATNTAQGWGGLGTRTPYVCPLRGEISASSKGDNKTVKL